MKKLLILLLAAMVTIMTRGADRPPNIVFILAADLGITDIGAYARHFTAAKADELYFETPHLDKLVADGIAFSQSYANQLCSPTRAALEETGLAENTVLVFTSDNGGVTYTDPPATTNTPFKGGKAMLYEGGVRVPTIIWQPGRSEGGAWCDAVTDCTDFLPTVADLTGNPPPKDIDGRSMVPLLKDPASPAAERTLIWHYPFNVSVKHPDLGTPLPPHSAIRVGDYKLIWNWHGRLELYNIPGDPFETHDLSNKNPELTAKLHTRLKQWLKENVAPRYWPQRDKAVSPEAAGGSFPFRDLL